MDITAALAQADRQLALSQPHLHPRPGPIRTVERQAQQRQQARAKAAGGQKLGLLGKLKQMRAARQMQASKRDDVTNTPPPAQTPEQRKRNDEVHRELQADLTKTLTRTMRACAGRWCDEDRARRIEESPAVQDLLARTTGWVHGIPDVAKLLVVTGAKLL